MTSSKQRKAKMLQKLINHKKNLRFKEFQNIVVASGYQLVRINGSHHIYKHENVPEAINIQNYKGKAKPYQVSQFINIVKKYDLL